MIQGFLLISIISFAKWSIIHLTKLALTIWFIGMNPRQVLSSKSTKFNILFEAALISTSKDIIWSLTATGRVDSRLPKSSKMLITAEISMIAQKLLKRLPLKFKDESFGAIKSTPGSTMSPRPVAVKMDSSVQTTDRAPWTGLVWSPLRILYIGH